LFCFDSLKNFTIEHSVATDRPTLAGIAIRHPSFRSVGVPQSARALAEAEIVNATIIAARRVAVAEIMRVRAEVVSLSI